QSGDRQVSELLAWQPGKRRSDFDGALVIGFRRRAIEPDLGGVECGGRNLAPLFDSDILISRTLLREDDRGRVDHLPADVSVVEGIAEEDCVPIRETVIDSTLREVFVGGLRSRKEILGGPA